MFKLNKQVTKQCLQYNLIFAFKKEMSVYSGSINCSAFFSYADFVIKYFPRNNLSSVSDQSAYATFLISQQRKKMSGGHGR